MLYEVITTFLNAYTNTIDPHTDYFDTREAERFNQLMSQSLEGIGAQLQKQDDVVVIRELIPGGQKGPDVPADDRRPVVPEEHLASVAELGDDTVVVGGEYSYNFV